MDLAESDCEVADTDLHIVAALGEDAAGSHCGAGLIAGLDGALYG